MGRWVSIASIFFVAFPLLAPLSAPTASAAPTSSHLTPASGVPIQVGGFLTSDDHFLVFVGVTGWGGAYTTVSNGSQVYAANLEVVIYSLVSSTINCPITLKEQGSSYPQTVTISPGVPAVVTVNVQPIHAWTTVILIVDNTPQYYSVAVPLSFLPNNVANIGGLDLIALAILSEALIALALAMSLAYGFMRRAIWAPKFSLLVWGHVILIGIASAVLLDFQEVDEIFAGWSPLVYAAFLFPIFFLFALSFFNAAPTAELLQANAPLSGRLSFKRWDIRIGKDAKGRWVLIGERWRDWLARVFGHHVPLTTVESTITAPELFMGDVSNRRLMSREQILDRGGKGEQAEQLLRRVRKPTPAKSSPLDDFDVIPASFTGRPARGRREPPVKLLFTPVGRPVEVDWPRLSMHRDVVVPAKLNEAGAVIVPEHHRNKLSLPHYTEGRAMLTLHTIHFRAAISVVSGWRTAEDLAMVLSDVVLDLEALKAAYYTSIETKVREKLLARQSLIDRAEQDLSEEEAVLESEREKTDAGLLDVMRQYGAGYVPPGSLDDRGSTQSRKRGGR